MSAGAASVPVPEACPRDAGRPADSRSRDAEHQADDGFAGLLTAIADDRAGPPGPPGEAEASEATARTATAEGQEGESDSPAPTGIEQALVALAANATAAPGETLGAVPPQAPVPQQDSETAAAPAEPKVAAQAQPAQAQSAQAHPAQAASSLTAAESTSAEAAAQQIEANEQESATAGLVAPRGEGQRRLDGKPANTPHSPTPVQSATGVAANAALEAGTEAEAPEAPSPSGMPTPHVTPAATPAPAAELRGEARHVRPPTHPQAEHGDELGSTAAAAATTAEGAKRASGATAAPAHDTPRATATATATEPARFEQPAAQPASAVDAGRQVDTGAKTPATAPHGRTPLHELVARVRETIRVTVREERTEARITLHPAELGEVRIRITYGPGGISASIVADSSRAAQTLAQSTPELRRTLEEHGVTLQSVDVQVGGDGAQLNSESGRGNAAAESDGDARRESTRDTAATPDEATDPEPSRDAPLGAYVDVLA